jgi:hypothetical protein
MKHLQAISPRGGLTRNRENQEKSDLPEEFLIREAENAWSPRAVRISEQTNESYWLQPRSVKYF